jgi:hypothetical protein
MGPIVLELLALITMTAYRRVASITNVKYATTLNLKCLVQESTVRLTLIVCQVHAKIMYVSLALMIAIMTLKTLVQLPIAMEKPVV